LLPCPLFVDAPVANEVGASVDPVLPLFARLSASWFDMTVSSANTNGKMKEAHTHRVLKNFILEFS